jgi:hypothetical protein
MCKVETLVATWKVLIIVQGVDSQVISMNWRLDRSNGLEWSFKPTGGNQSSAMEANRLIMKYGSLVWKNVRLVTQVEQEAS